MAGWPEAVLGDRHLGALPDDVAAEADPVPTRQLEPEVAHFGQRALEPAVEPRRLEDDEPGADPVGVGREPAHELVLAAGEATGQVDHEQVDGPTREERARQAEALARVGRADDDEPAQVDAAAHRLERVEGPRQVEPGDDGAVRLGLGQAAQGERRLPRRGAAADRGARLARQAARAQDRVKLREAGRDDLVAERLEGMRAGSGVLVGEWLEDGREGALVGDREARAGSLVRDGSAVPCRDDTLDTGAVAEADGGASPARLEPGEGIAEGSVGGPVGGPVRGRHARSIVEHLFYSSSPEPPHTWRRRG